MRSETNFNLAIEYSTEQIGSHIEEGHGLHELGNYTDIIIKKVVIETNDKSIDITKYLPESILNKIANQIDIE